MKIIQHKRKEYFPNATVGEISLPDREGAFCYTLEDVDRDGEAKVYGKTAIPKGDYFVQVRYSPRFKRELLYLYNDYGEYIPKVVRDGKSFKYIAVHGGNTVQDTEGCVLVAFNRTSNTTINGRADKELFKIVQPWVLSGEKIIWRIS